MNGIRSLINYFFIAFPVQVLEEANDLHKRVRAVLVWSALIGVLAIVLNCLGAGVVNYWLAIALNVLVLILATLPAILLDVWGAGAVLGLGRRPVESGNKMVKIWLDINGQYLLFLTIFLVASGFLSYKESPYSLGMVLAVLILFFWMDKTWGMKAVFPRKLIFAVSVIVVTIGIASFVPRPMYIKYVGFSPFDLLTVTEIDRTLSEMEEVKLISENKKIEKRLKKLEVLLQRGYTLNDDDALFFETELQKRDERSAPVIIKNTVNNVIGVVFNDEDISPGTGQLVKADPVKVYYPRPEPYTFSLKAGQQTDWITFPIGKYNYNFDTVGGSFKIVYDDGEVVDSRTARGLPKKTNFKFKIQAIDDIELEMDLREV